ncbi:amino acid ABC transporter ATP-binding protein [Oligella ureolytica]
MFIGHLQWYGNAQVLNDCSTHVNRKEVLVVCGPSGSGKSTLIKTVNGLEPFQEGKIIVNGISVGDPGINLPALRAKVGMVFQNFELFPHLTVRANLALAQQKVLGRSKDEAHANVKKHLTRVGLADFEDRYPASLSGGQQQRVAIARALCMDPVCMLFDEPTSALSP